MTAADIFRFIGALGTAPIKGPVGLGLKAAGLISNLVAEVIDRHGEDTAKAILQEIVLNPEYATPDAIRDAAEKRRAELEPKADS